MAIFWHILTTPLAVQVKQLVVYLENNLYLENNF